MLGLTHHKHGDTTQLTQSCIDLETLENHSNSFAEDVFKVFDAHAVEADGADFGQVDLAVSIQGLAAEDEISFLDLLHTIVDNLRL
uniref:hypothetical protein n=1 Tax=Limnohabitans sp. TaxID=1907725 RepID=UPI004047B0DF